MPARSAWGNVRRWAPRIGWPASVLLILAVWAACAGIMAADWVQGDIALLYTGTLALLVSAALAASPLPGRWAASIAGLSGLLLVVQLVAHPFPPLQDMRQWLGALGTWLWQRAAGASPPPLDLSLWAESVGRWAVLVERLAAWAASLAGGPSSPNPAAFLFVSGIVMWASVAWAVWWTARHGRPLPAMLPLGLLLSTSTYLAGAPLEWVLAFAGCVAILLPVVHLRMQEVRWEREGIDYSPEIGFDVWQVAIFVTIGALLLSLLTPNLQLPRLVSSFWEWIEPARETVADGATRLFGGVQPREPPQLPGGEGTGTGEARTGGDLPRAHLLGGNPRLLRRHVMTVCVDAPLPAMVESTAEEGLVGPKYYWRGITYDTFDGRSWRNGPFYRDELLPYEPVQESLPGEVGSLRQRYRIEAGEGQTLYAVAEPAAVDQPLTRLLRGSGDLIGLRGTAREYAVRSEVLQVSASDLRAAPSVVPDPVRSRYLALGEDTPTQLRKLAAAITVGADTAYDAALTIERYLRQFEYDLHVPPPPPDQDAVAYFLLDLQRGYCDYYASAFVVLARAAGVPARLAVGYATGAYDPDQGCYEVLELDGHSWPEVYFSGYGWVPFEPTPAYQPFERSPVQVSSTQPQVPVPAPPHRSPVQVLRVWWQRARSGAAVYVLGAGAALLVAAAIRTGYRTWWRSRLLPAAAAALCYAEMARLGRRLGAQRQPSQTPREYRDRLSAALHSRVARTSWCERTMKAALNEAAACIEVISDAYVRASYRANPLTTWECARAVAAWRSLRRRMWWLWATSVKTV